jgi:molybdopterin-biosynthesis enzyme MoeA-like protein
VNTVAKAVIGVLGVTLPALFSYLSARSESNEAKVRAEVAYVTLQASVVELQKEAKEQGEALADVRARAEMLENRLNARPVFVRPPHEHKADEMPAPPERFMDAVEQYKAKR